MQSDEPQPHPLILIRHGESTWNESATVQGQANGATLTENGRRQVRNAVKTLGNEAFDEIISSDLQRAVETAHIIAEALGLSVSTSCALRERSFGAYEGRPLTELGRDASGIFDGKVVDATTRPEGGESLDEFFNRVRSFIDFLRAKDDQRRALLVTHGGTIRVIRAYGVGAQMQGLVWDRVANASIWSVTFNGPGH